MFRVMVASLTLCVLSLLIFLYFQHLKNLHSSALLAFLRRICVKKCCQLTDEVALHVGSLSRPIEPLVKDVEVHVGHELAAGGFAKMSRDTRLAFCNKKDPLSEKVFPSRKFVQYFTANVIPIERRMLWRVRKHVDTKQ